LVCKITMTAVRFFSCFDTIMAPAYESKSLNSK
jgi:hypothetical protein